MKDISKIFEKCKKCKVPLIQTDKFPDVYHPFKTFTRLIMVLVAALVRKANFSDIRPWTLYYCPRCYKYWRIYDFSLEIY